MCLWSNKWHFPISLAYVQNIVTLLPNLHSQGRGRWPCGLSACFGSPGLLYNTLWSPQVLSGVTPEQWARNSSWTLLRMAKQTNKTRQLLMLRKSDSPDSDYKVPRSLYQMLLKIWLKIIHWRLHFAATSQRTSTWSCVLMGLLCICSTSEASHVQEKKNGSFRIIEPGLIW